MSRSAVNFLIDVLAFVAMVLLGATGALVRYVLPAGSGHFLKLWGMDRHEWGQIHFWIAVALLALVVVHLVLHWRWIVSMIRGRTEGMPATRAALAVVAVLVLAGVAAAPFFSPVEQTGQPPHKGQAEQNSKHAEDLEHSITGSMTLREVEQQTGVPAAVIIEELGLPADVSVDEQLGRLRRQHGFQMHEVRDVVEKHRPRPQ